MPSASFLLMMDAQIRYGLSTVPVTSRSAYNLRSAGAIFSVCPIMQQPQALSTRRNSGTDRPTRNPGIDSSLSSVPPVWPSPRPLIIGTIKPAGRDERSEHERSLVADAAGGMLVDFLRGQETEVEHFAGVQHRVGQSGRFLARHSAQDDRHQPGGHLVIGNASVAWIPQQDNRFRRPKVRRHRAFCG